ncbi:ABC transporter substrate-binding protein [Azospirillum sp. sgz302134]
MAASTRNTPCLSILLLLVMTALPIGGPPLALAQPGPSAPEAVQAGASAPVARLNEALLDLMKRGARESKRARLERFLPVMQDVFDLDAALRIASAPYFERADGDEQRRALDAFARRGAAQYVDRFDRYDGQTITIDGERPGPRGTTLVDTTLARPEKAPVRLTYVLRPEGGRWKILDVLAKGTVSQLAAQRSEFQTSLRNEGLAGLTRDLNANADRLLGGG